MQEIAKRIQNRALELLADGTVSRVLGWEKGETQADWTPALFESAEEMKDFVYGEYAGANLSKYCLKLKRLEGRTLVVLKPCDTLSFHQLTKEHRLDREKFYIIGAGCKGMKDEAGTLLKCNACKGKEFVVYDEIIDDEESRKPSAVMDRMDGVSDLEKMTAQQRYDFWRGELSRCIRCNACRNVCPACTCEKCVFDNPASGAASKAPVTDFEENMFHIIRAYHVAGRCTDCGECSRVCPQHIPLHLLNRKFIKDMNELYGDYQAGEGDDERTPMTSYTKEDAEPGIVKERGNA
ncbi:MAG: 4Fe-4S dicluster domain-containing protein [Eubacteriales bacterium]|nr:4Fe-4S dicluster domain-containing protein [Eubacteriales bacterium]